MQWISPLAGPKQQENDTTATGTAPPAGFKPAAQQLSHFVILTSSNGIPSRLSGIKGPCLSRLSLVVCQPHPVLFPFHFECWFKSAVLDLSTDHPQRHLAYVLHYRPQLNDFNLLKK